MKCPDCNGTGKIELLTSTKACGVCRGSGTMPDVMTFRSEGVCLNIGNGNVAAPFGNAACDARYPTVSLGVSGADEAIKQLDGAMQALRDITEVKISLTDEQKREFQELMAKERNEHPLMLMPGEMFSATRKAIPKPGDQYPGPDGLTDTSKIAMGLRDELIRLARINADLHAVTVWHEYRDDERDEIAVHATVASNVLDAQQLHCIIRRELAESLPTDQLHKQIIQSLVAVHRFI